MLKILELITTIVVAIIAKNAVFKQNQFKAKTFELARKGAAMLIGAFVLSLICASSFILALTEAVRSVVAFGFYDPSLLVAYAVTFVLSSGILYYSFRKRTWEKRMAAVMPQIDKEEGQGLGAVLLSEFQRWQASVEQERQNSAYRSSAASQTPRTSAEVPPMH